ncbi:MAG: ATP-binding protein, partial [Eggerthellaceae bacterium]|nr:ATP-binding protein [Eggerthellaceae bacterium]
MRPVKGLLAYAMCARDMGYALVCSHFADGLIPVDGLRDRGIEKLRDLMDPECNAIDYGCPCPDAPEIDYADVSGNEVAKRAVQIAAAGNHGLLMMGPPGSGKTMLASRIPTIMPPLSDDERLQVALVHSVAGVDISECLQDCVPSGIRTTLRRHLGSSAGGLISGQVRYHLHILASCSLTTCPNSGAPCFSKCGSHSRR